MANPISRIDPLGLNEVCPNFGSEEKLKEHFEKHSNEFNVKTADEYLAIGRDVIKYGYKVSYYYKPTNEIRTGYAMFMKNTSKGVAKFAFVGLNPKGEIATIHTKSGKDFRKLLNKDAKNKTITLIMND